MDTPYRTIAAVEQDLQRFPPAISEEFQRAHEKLAPGVPSEDLLAWAVAGLRIAQQTIRSWEVSAEYYRVSPQVLSVLSFERFSVWAKQGETLSLQSPSIALSYFRVGFECVSILPMDRLAEWTQMGQSLYKGTWKSSIMAARFFDVSPAMLRALSFDDLGRLVQLLETLSHYSSDLAIEALALVADTFPRLEDSRGQLLSLLTVLVEKNWRDVKGTLEGAAKSLPRVDRQHRARFLRLAEQMITAGHSPVAPFVLDTSRAMGQLQPDGQARLLAMGEALIAIEYSVVPEFLRSGPTMLVRLKVPQAEAWFNEGVRLLKENKDAGVAFFRMESSHAEQLLESLSSTVELPKIKELMRMYSRALSGTQVEIASSQELAQKGIGWVSENKPTTEGSTVYLPPVVDQYPQKEENFDWYKVVTTHQVAHLEFDSFTFTYDRPSTLYKKDLRPRLSPKPRPPQITQGQPKPAIALEGWATDMQKFFDIFSERKMALDVFTLVEDGRLDVRVKREYAGIRSAYKRVQGDTLDTRETNEEMRAREMLVEMLVRLSLDQRTGLTIPATYKKEAERIARIAQRTFRHSQTVEDTSEATLRIYAILMSVPNKEVPPEDQEELDQSAENDSDQTGDSDSEDDKFLEQLQKEQQEKNESHQSGDEQESQEGGDAGEDKKYSSPRDVDFRGSFKPELVQLMNKLRQAQGQGQEEEQQQQISSEMLQQLLQNNVEMESPSKGDQQQVASLFANNLMREAGMPPANMPPMGQGPFVHMDEEGGPLEVHEPFSYLYDEWDFRAGDYKPRWCLVREKVVPEGDVGFWRQTVTTYAGLLNQIRRQFEMVVPESFRRIKGQTDGEDFDLDATLEAMIDKRAGITPSDKVYWKRNKVQRDVAVALLLDMSASTAEAIEEGSRSTDDWAAPNDPVEYMTWLRAHRGESGARRQYKRIIDIEKESAVLLMQGLELMDDKYGIYGFSGYGRENVEFSVIKDFHEPLNDNVRRRLDRVTPMHATRMGPAIRHATAKLDAVDAKTKVLFLLSDGRPQDRGYSREGVEKEYAVHDTKRALTEARRKNITPFCLTVDKSGHDYLKTMCQDMGYEVLADIHSLPERLPFLYRRLTV
ncbi:MAG: VWA domain-containing protein [Dehalococcoidia bacterium]|nr:VWA domain-containing protein [Dehalococcoidia bacterium]